MDGRKQSVSDAALEAARSGKEPRVTKLTFWAECLKGGFTEGQKHALNLEELGLESFKPSIRSSAVATYVECRRKYMLQERLGLKRKGSYASALGIGTWFHAIMAEFYRGCSPHVALGAAVRVYNETEEELRKHVNPMGFLVGTTKTLTETLSKMASDLQKAKVMALWLWEREALNFDEYEVLDIERVVEINYDTIKQPIRVRFDAIVRRRGTNELFIHDFKSTSKKPVDQIDTYLFALQPKLYRMACEALISAEKWVDEEGEPLRLVGFKHILIRKPTIKLKAKQTFDAYLEEVRAWYADGMESKPDDPPLVKSSIRFTEPVMTEELLMILREASRASGAGIDPSIYYRDPSGRACTAYNSRCPFLDLCSAPYVEWKDLIERLYRVEFRDLTDEEEED